MSHLSVVVLAPQPPLMPADGSPSDMEGRAQVHLVLWLGMTSHAANAPLWSNEVSGETVVFAETVSV